MSLAADVPLPRRSRALVAVAGLMGAAGVAAAAAGAHIGGGLLPTAAEILMVHAAAVAALAAFGAARPGRAAGTDLAAAVLALGAVLFGGDLVLRDLLELRLVPYAAPVGGVAMIAGWLLAAVAALVGR